jgi:hypothetical protein
MITRRATDLLLPRAGSLWNMDLKWNS